MFEEKCLGDFIYFMFYFIYILFLLFFILLFYFILFCLTLFYFNLFNFLLFFILFILFSDAKLHTWNTKLPSVCTRLRLVGRGSHCGQAQRDKLLCLCTVLQDQGMEGARTTSALPVKGERGGSSMNLGENKSQGEMLVKTPRSGQGSCSHKA